MPIGQQTGTGRDQHPVSGLRHGRSHHQVTGARDGDAGHRRAGRLAGAGRGGPAPGPGVEVVDAGGTTAGAGMVDAHSHLTLPGESHWIDRAGDPTDRLLAVAEDNARLLRQAGVRWARDVGAPVRDGRALSLTVRERWRGRAGYPYVRAASCWVGRTGSLPSGLPVEVNETSPLPGPRCFRRCSRPA
jgi:hypothetical protein